MLVGAGSCGHPCIPEITVDRSEVITKQELQNPPAEQSASMQPGQASPTVDLGRLRRVPRWASTGWSHHGDYAAHASITRGGMTVEFGPGSTEQDEAGEGDFIYIPEHLIHREAKEEKAWSSASAELVPASSTSRGRTRRHDAAGLVRC